MAEALHHKKDKTRHYQKPGRILAASAAALTASVIAGSQLDRGNAADPVSASASPITPETAPPITPTEKNAAEQAANDSLSCLLGIKWLHFEGGMAHIRLGNEDYEIVEPLVANRDGIELVGWFNRPVDNATAANVEFIARNQVLDWSGVQLPPSIDYHKTYEVSFPPTAATPLGAKYDLRNPVGAHNKPLAQIGQIGYLYDAGNLQSPLTPPVDSQPSATQNV